MPFPIRITDKHEHDHLEETHALQYPLADDRRPIIAFLDGLSAYRIVSSEDRAGYGDNDKFTKITAAIMDRKVIELPVLLSNYLAKGRFQVFDGRHRATIFMLLPEIARCGHLGPTIDPESYDLSPTPFLTLTIFARKLDELGYLSSAPGAFDMSMCKADVFAPRNGRL